VPCFVVKEKASIGDGFGAARFGCWFLDWKVAIDG